MSGQLQSFFDVYQKLVVKRKIIPLSYQEAVSLYFPKQDLSKPRKENISKNIVN